MVTINYQKYMDKIILQSVQDRLCGKVSFILDMYANTIDGGTKLFSSRAVTLECPFNLKEYLERQIDGVLVVWGDEYHRSRVQCKISGVSDDFRDYSMRKSEVKSIKGWTVEDISELWGEIRSPRYIDF